MNRHMNLCNSVNVLISHRLFACSLFHMYVLACGLYKVRYAWKTEMGDYKSRMRARCLNDLSLDAFLLEPSVLESENMSMRRRLQKKAETPEEMKICISLTVTTICQPRKLKNHRALYSVTTQLYYWRDLAVFHIVL
jgi:hypothetical protein